MPHKGKSTGAEGQAPPLRKIGADIARRLLALDERMRALRAQDEPRQPLDKKLLDEIRRTDLDKLRPLLGVDPDKFHERAANFWQQVVGSSAVPPVKQKQTKWRVKIQHADEAIDRMIDERRADPDKFGLVKTQVERVAEILQKQHHEMVPKSQRRTLRRMIAERMALLGQT